LYNHVSLFLETSHTIPRWGSLVASLIHLVPHPRLFSKNDIHLHAITIILIQILAIEH
ncbi:unnamed protein product, partial [Sphenostylis stenocarpa]